MKTTAASIMTKDFPSLFPETPLTDAIRIFRESSRQSGRRFFGILVTDKDRRLVGMALIEVRPLATASTSSLSIRSMPFLPSIPHNSPWAWCRKPIL
ncbi:MAG: CBS domain-containing protein [Pseudomonadota bacterium]